MSAQRITHALIELRLAAEASDLPLTREQFQSVATNPESAALSHPCPLVAGAAQELADALYEAVMVPDDMIAKDVAESAGDEFEGLEALEEFAKQDGGDTAKGYKVSHWINKKIIDAHSDPHKLRAHIMRIDQNIKAVDKHLAKGRVRRAFGAAGTSLAGSVVGAAVGSGGIKAAAATLGPVTTGAIVGGIAAGGAVISGVHDYATNSRHHRRLRRTLLDARHYANDRLRRLGHPSK